jgi:HEAT repeat protein
MRAATILPAALTLLATACVSEGTQAQALAQRVRAASDGMAELHFAARPGVCGDGRRYFSMGRRSYFGEYNSDRDGRMSCQPGPARVRMRVERGTISDLKVTVGPPIVHEERTTDLGEISSAEAARYLLALADTSSRGVAREAITAAVLADSVSVWPQLLALAADTAHASRSTRHDAMFWVGRFAAAKVSGHGEDITADEDDRSDRDDARDAAVFALSQLHGREGVEPLLQVARSHKDPQLRQKAIFWLGESGDPRAVALFREILKG